MKTFETKALEHYGEVCVEKSLVRIAELGSRSIPRYVSEWIVSRYAPAGKFDDGARQKMLEFIDRHLPAKDQKEHLKLRLQQGETLLILDEFSISIDLRTNEQYLKIPCLDETRAGVNSMIAPQNPLLLGSGVWGVGKLTYLFPSDDKKADGRILMTEFKPMQAAQINLALFTQQRQYFTLDEWRDLLVSSMGYNPDFYSPEQKMYLLTRLIPIVQERVNFIELAPKGTGKSFVYLNLSRYVRLISGGKVTAAVLFYNNQTNQSGLLTNYDVVVFDEAQTLSFDNPGEIVGVLKDYLESGRYSRGGKHQATATAGIVMLANIPIDDNGNPRFSNLFLNLPSFLRETALIDRIHGIVPGWKLPRIEATAISESIGFKADFFGEVLHHIRNKAGYAEYITANGNLSGISDVRDRNAINRIATGFLKLLFPDFQVSHQEMIDYCLRPAATLRQCVRDQLAEMDPEFKRVYLEVH